MIALLLAFAIVALTAFAFGWFAAICWSAATADMRRAGPWREGEPSGSSIDAERDGW